MDLAAKTEQALAILEALLDKHGPERVRVAWTGGKDSTLALFLWRTVLSRACPGTRPLALSLDTGRKFPEVIAFRDSLAVEWDVDVAVVRPGRTPQGFVPAGDKEACCGLLKIEPLKRGIAECGVSALITGIRRDEHASRKDREHLEQRAAPDHVLANPILEFTEMDVWSFHTQHAIPWCPLYDQGYRSLGCMDCTVPPAGSHTSERDGRDQDKERILSRLTSLGYF